MKHSMRFPRFARLLFALALLVVPVFGLAAAPALAATPGTVVAWGDNDYGQTDVPAGVTSVTAISAGGYHTVALKSDGTVVAWGFDNYGQTDVPAGLTGVTAIAAGGYHTVALKSDGTVVAWGNNTYGQANAPAGVTGVTAIAAGYFHTVALVTQDTTAPTFGACPAAGPFLLNSGAQTVGPIAASDEPGGSGLDKNRQHPDRLG